ncbi:MAG TPA: NAD(P)H-dependent glycerol-3-phosphate dehydrogenase [Spirochaetota bacterium]|nr:NAD(P)H-dependent glycerol-3-phosphate dehydrogenase [Spirochaetota bacterium]HOL56669.1 NAD(P)H-dependent glycerol-3-phosphate dehydrogenase [Spirochaetota bacterium]HPP03305.1 NAD(P)H-dependent glycerol-3-phosphate dehydrogenase [Spirochaetota bacterium]
MDNIKEKIAVLGAGSWGNTLAVMLCQKFDVTMWEYNKDLAIQFQQDRENKIFLKGIRFPDNLKVTNDLKEAVENAKIVVFAVPSFALRNLCNNVKDFITEKQLLVTVIKGLEDGTFMRMSQIIDTVIPKKRGVVALSGPTHAEEVSRGIPTTIVAACPDLKLAEEVQKAFMTDFFRVYTNEDIIGVEIAAACKNVIAILAGISDGIGFGDNTKAALITRGLAEIIRLGKKIHAKERTFSGLAGIGDLIVTCQSKHSRNRYVGEELGKGRSIDDILSSMTMVAEGVKNCKSIYNYAKSLGVEMPLTEELYRILYEKADLKDSLKRLLSRKEKYEHWE